jgi:peptidoglycan/LPS O-acetylase OafA/YrhL
MSLKSHETNRLVQLDALRAFAVLGVILHHSTRWQFPLELGPYSVRLFFVLSGFLITGILLKARQKSYDVNRSYTLRAFYARRFLRIFPIYYLSLAALCFLGQPDIRATSVWHFLYLSNVLSAIPTVDIPSVWGHLWSLSVEEQFYLLWPTIVLFVPRVWLPIVFLSAIATGPLFRMLAGTNMGFRSAVYLTPGCLDSLGLGAFLSWLASQPRMDAVRKQFCRWALLVGLILVAATTADAHWNVSWKFWLLTRDLGPALVFCWLVNGAAMGFSGWMGRLLECRPLMFLGTISYGMYLYHNFIPWFCEYASIGLPMHGGMRFLYLAPLTTVAAAVSWYLIEKPLNNLKDRFPYVRGNIARGAIPDEHSIPTLAQSVPEIGLNNSAST